MSLQISVNRYFILKHRPHFEMKRDVFKTNTNWALRNNWVEIRMNRVSGFSLDYLFFKWIIRFDCYLTACWHWKWTSLSVRDKVWTNVPNGPVNILGYKNLISFSLKSNKSPFFLIVRAPFRISSSTIFLHTNISLLPSPRLSPQLLKRFLSIHMLNTVEPSELFLLIFI